MNTFITSDTHFYQKNIVPAITTWESGATREFINEIVMTETLIHNINAQAKENDIIRHGGDWSFGGISRIVDARLAIKCNMIQLSLGNHDEHIMLNKPIPPQLLSDCQLRFGSSTKNLQDLFETVSLTQEFRIEGVRTTLSHYAQRSWNKSHFGAIQLHGHSHAGLERTEEYLTCLPTGNHPVNEFYNQFTTMDVGIDNAFRLYGLYKMFSIYEISEIMKNRKPLKFIDHHDGSR